MSSTKEIKYCIRLFLLRILYKPDKHEYAAKRKKYITNINI